MSTVRKILGNTLSQVVGRFATALLAVIVVKILTVYLGQAGYGQYAMVYEFLAFFGAFADFGIFTIAVREMSRKKEDEEIIFGNTLTLRTLFTATAMLTASGVVFLIPQYQNTIIPLGVCIAALSTFFVILSGTLSAALQIRLRMELAALSLVIGKVFTVVCILFLTQEIFPDSPEESFYFLIWAGSFGAGITFILTALFTRKVFPIHFRFDWERIKPLLRESAPFAVALALNTFYIRMDILLLSLLLPISEDGVCNANFCSDTEVGYYAVGARILEILLMIPIYFMNSVLPSLTRIIAEKSKKLFVFLENTFSFLLAVGLPAGFLLFLLSRETVQIISSNSFLSTADSFGSDTALQILSFVVPTAFCSMFFGFLLIAIGRQSTLIWINLLAVSFNLALDFWAIPQFGFVGAALASAVSEMAMLSLMIFFSYRAVQFFPKPSMLFRIFFSAFVASGVTWMAYNFMNSLGSVLTLLLIVFLYFLVYFVLLWNSKVITPQILGMLKKGNTEMKDE